MLNVGFIRFSKLIPYKGLIVIILAMDTIQFPCRPLFEGGAPSALELDDADGRTNAELNPPWGFARRYTMALVPSVTSM